MGVLVGVVKQEHKLCSLLGCWCWKSMQPNYVHLIQPLAGQCMVRLNAEHQRSALSCNPHAHRLRKRLPCRQSSPPIFIPISPWCNQWLTFREVQDDQLASLSASCPSPFDSLCQLVRTLDLFILLYFTVRHIQQVPGLVARACYWVLHEQG